jgi:short-subunit dehydrogenase
MNPIEQIGNAVIKPVGVVTRALNRPTSLGRHRPLYPLAVLEALFRGDLREAVEGKVILITGASSGIGATAARQLGEVGAEVVLVARGVEKLQDTAARVEEAGGTAHVYPTDLTDLDAIVELAEQVQSDVGRVDILVNNAGKSIRRSLALSYDRVHDYQRTMQLNYFAPLQLMLKLLPGMRRRKFGHIVNVSSIGVQTRVPRFGAYIASKAALDTLCDSWQGETQHDNVRFTTVHMALVRTPMIEATTIYDRFPVLTPEDAADVVCRTMINRPRRVSPPFGSLAAFADAISPEIMDRIRNRGYQLFDDSAAAKGETGGLDKPISAQGRMFAEVTRGVHW